MEGRKCQAVRVRNFYDLPEFSVRKALLHNTKDKEKSKTRESQES